MSDEAPDLRGRRRARAVRAGLAVAVAAVLAAPLPAAAVPVHHAPSTVTYRASHANIANPERGMDHETDTHYRAGGKGWEPLSASRLRRWRALGDTQINRVVYLDAFAKGASISKGFLARQQRDFDTARRAGFTIVLRFAYVEGGDEPYVAPFGDATLATTLKHIRQLTPLLRRNVGVIATLQMGFVGLWGEGYYTDHFADPKTQEVSDADWAKRRAVVDAELKALPTRAVQVRTPQMKQRMTGTGTGAAAALTADEAYRHTRKARIGHHDDCFVASPDDFGTFLSDPISLDEAYLARDSRFVPVGGETCAVAPPVSEFPNASARLERFHYSYLNREYNTDVLDSWGAKGIATVERKLGYRFQLLSSTVRAGSVSIRIRNSGWAAPYNPRPVRLVLVGAHGHRYTVPVATDVRRWAAGTTRTVHAAVRSLPHGAYRAFLALPAAERATAHDPRYAIRTANVDTWHASSGLNDLHQTVHVR